MIYQIIALVAIVLIVFEGRMVLTMLSPHSSSGVETVSAPAPAVPDESGQLTDEIASSQEGTGIAPVDPASLSDPANAADPSVQDGANADGTMQTTLVGFQDGAGTTAYATEDSGFSQDSLYTQSAADSQDPAANSPYTVAQQAVSVDDSFFSDAVFIGDSRMLGFRNTSGITQGTFLTSVGMNMTNLPTTTVDTIDGIVTIYQALSGRQYQKIYIMLGTNDLGYYDWTIFLDMVESVLRQIHELQPSAVIYICSVIYVEDDKTEEDYVSNENVMRVNGYLLEACSHLNYCHYLNLNEIFDNGNHSLIEGASSDGVHLEQKYTKMMLLYLKSHYIPAAAAGGSSSAPASAESQDTAQAADSSGEL